MVSPDVFASTRLDRWISLQMLSDMLQCQSRIPQEYNLVDVRIVRNRRFHFAFNITRLFLFWSENCKLESGNELGLTERARHGNLYFSLAPEKYLGKIWDLISTLYSMFMV